jgi:hypothetical protein
VTVDNVTEIKRANGSRILGVPKGENQVRLFHPHGFVLDEAALSGPRACLVGDFVAQQAICINTCSRNNLKGKHRFLLRSCLLVNKEVVTVTR